MSILCAIYQRKQVMPPRKIGAGLLLLLFSLYLGAIVATYHANLVHGRLVAHAHARLAKNFASDIHTPTELVLLEQFCNIQITGEIICHVKVVRPTVWVAFSFAPEEPTEYSTLQPTYHRRGPPVVA